MRFFATTALALFALTGCMGMRQGEIQNLPAHTIQSSRSVDEVLSCVKSGEPDLRGIADFTTYPIGGKVEISIGANQAPGWREYYHVMISPDGAGSQVEARTSGRTFAPLSQEQFDRMLKRCT